MRDGRDLASFASEESDHLRALLLSRVAPDAVEELLEVSPETAQRYREQSAPAGENRLSQMAELFLEAQSRMKYLSSARAALELCTVRACRPQEEAEGGLEGVLARIEALEAMPRAQQAAPSGAAPSKAPQPKKPASSEPAPRQAQAARATPEPTPPEYEKALEALAAAKPCCARSSPPCALSAARAIASWPCSPKSAALQMSLLERFRPQIEEALSEAFGETMSLRMRREDERPRGLDRPVRQIITQAQDLFGEQNVELGDE